MKALTATEAWLQALNDIWNHGDRVEPRGMPTLEIQHRTVSTSMQFPVINFAPRKLSYQFMAAEAYWILSGDDRVSTIAPYNKHISQFSDNGETFDGAYGPKIVDQLEYIVNTLDQDEDTRQATLTIWRENPGPSKDIPCTVALDFKIRNGMINVHAFMRSSDVWLGLPYDLFNFSMIGARVCGLVNHRRRVRGEPELTLGTLYLTAASSHMYKRNEEGILKCIQERFVHDTDSNVVPPELYTAAGCDGRLLDVLNNLRNSKPGDAIRWWEK